MRSSWTCKPQNNSCMPCLTSCRPARTQLAWDVTDCTQTHSHTEASITHLRSVCGRKARNIAVKSLRKQATQNTQDQRKRWERATAFTPCRSSLQKNALAKQRLQRGTRCNRQRTSNQEIGHCIDSSGGCVGIVRLPGVASWQNTRNLGGFAAQICYGLP